MANVTSAYAIGVTIDLDSAEVTTGASQAELAIENLESSVASSASSMETSLAGVGTTATTELGTTVPSAVDSGAASLTTKASKFKAVGTELGATLTEGIAGGASAPEQVANVGNSLSGLLALSAGTAGGAIGAIAVGLGGTIVSKMVAGIQASKAEFAAAVETLFDSIELEAGKSANAIRREMIGALTVQQTVTDLTGDLESGWELVTEAVQGTGRSSGEIVTLLQKGLKPSTQAIYDDVVAWQEESKAWYDTLGLSGVALSDNAKKSETILDYAVRQSRALDQASDTASGLAQTMDEVGESSKGASDNVGRAADNASRLAYNLDQAARAAERLNTRTANGLGDDVA